MLVSLLLRRRINALKPEALDRFDMSIGGGLAFTRYVFGSGHRELQDPLVDRLALAYKILLCAVVAFLSAGFLLTFWPRGSSGPRIAGSAHEHPLNAYGVVLLGLIGGVFALYAWFCRYLRQAHPPIWERLGRPALLMNNTPFNGAKTFGFIWSAEHHDIGDPKVSIAVYAIRLAYIAFGLALVVLGRLA
jgi:hypothetical protein